MTNSAINPNINEQFPVPGVENDSQVFRDNFATIKSSLTSAKTEIEQFLNHGVRDDTPVTNLNGNVLSTYVRISESDYRHGITGLQIANFDLNYNNGLYQNVKIGADLRINLINFPTDTSDVRKVGKVRLHMSADSTDRKVMFAAANAALKYDESYPLVDSNKITVKGSSTENATIVDIWQVNDGTLTPSVYIKYIGYFQYRTTQPPAPIRYSDNFGSIQNIASFAASTDDTTPGIVVGTRLSSTPKLYVDGTFTAANYNSALGTLTPNQPIAVGSHQFKYTLTDATGYESGLSEPITINIDTTAPAAPTAAPSSYNDAVGSITANNSTALTTDDTRPGIHISANLIDTPQLYVNDAPVASTYESDSTVGTLRPDIALADGSYTFAYSLIDEAGNESGKSPTIAITIDTTLPIINTVTLSWGSELESSEMSADGTITVATTGVENGQTVTVALNAVNYTGTTTNNTATITIPMAALAALTNGNSYNIVTSVKDLAGNAATNNTTSFTVSTVVDGGWDGITQLGPNGLGARLNYITIDSNNIPIVGGFNNSQGLITRYNTAYNATKQITLGIADTVVYGVATD